MLASSQIGGATGLCAGSGAKHVDASRRGAHAEVAEEATDAGAQAAAPGEDRMHAMVLEMP